MALAPTAAGGACVGEEEGEEIRCPPSTSAPTLEWLLASLRLKMALGRSEDARGRRHRGWPYCSQSCALSSSFEMCSTRPVSRTLDEAMTMTNRTPRTQAVSRPMLRTSRTRAELAKRTPIVLITGTNPSRMGLDL